MGGLPPILNWSPTKFRPPPVKNPGYAYAVKIFFLPSPKSECIFGEDLFFIHVKLKKKCSEFLVKLAPLAQTSRYTIVCNKCKYPPYYLFLIPFVSYKFCYKNYYVLRLKNTVTSKLFVTF